MCKTLSSEAGFTRLLDDLSSLAYLLNTSTRALHRTHSSGQLPAPVRLGGRWRWRRAEICAWIEAGCPDRVKWEAMGGRHE